MDLFKWMGVGSNAQPPSNATHGPKSGGVKPINHAEYKQFGLENFGNTCYANSVLQALYFCGPFRELVCDSPDKSNPPIPTVQIQPPVQSLSAPPPARPPGLKGFRRRDSAVDGIKSSEDPPVNGLAFSKSPLSVPSGPPIPATPPTLFSALRSLFLHIALNPSDKGKVPPKAFINKLKEENELYRSSMHQDAHEFLGFLLNKIVEDLEVQMKKSTETNGDDLSSSLGSLPTASSSTASPPSHSSTSQRKHQPHKTFVHTLFEGTLTSETRCLTCETVSSRDESFLDLSIDIEQNSSVTACLRQFSASEMLSQKNKFFCDSCGGLQEAEKRMKIKKLPNVLALHLKRFKYQEDVQKYIKLSYRVAFPFELRLFNTVDDALDPDRLYQLFAIVVHIGGGPHHGHYIAIVKARGTWFVFDDDSVEPIREGDIVKYFGDSPGGSGYVLFYQAVDLDMASIGIETPDAPEAEVAHEAEVESSGDADSEPVVASSSSSATPGSVSASASVLPLKVDIPTVVDSGMLPSATPTVTPTVVPAPPLVVPGSPVVVPPLSIPAHHQSASNASTNSNNTGFFSSVSLGRTLKHSQSVKITSDKERDKRRVSGSNQEMSDTEIKNSNAGDIATPSLAHSKSLKNKESIGWFSSRKKDKKDKHASSMSQPPVPPLPATPVEGGLSVPSPVPPSERDDDTEYLRPTRSSISSSTASHTQSQSHAHSPVIATSSISASPSSAPLIPTDVPRPSAPRTSRPATSPSSFPSPISDSRGFDAPLPPLPPLPAGVTGSPLTPTSPRSRHTSHVLAASSSSVPAAPSQTLTAPPISEPPLLFTPVRTTTTPERPNTPGGSLKPKRASRKMSLSAMPLAGMFGRKDKDKEKDRSEKEREKEKLLRRPQTSGPMVR